MRNVILEAAKEYQDRASAWAAIARADVEADRPYMAASAQKYAAHESKMARQLMDIDA